MPERSDDDEQNNRHADRSVIALLAAFVAYLLVLPELGFVIATVPFFAALMVVYGERRPAWVAAGRPSCRWAEADAKTGTRNEWNPPPGSKMARNPPP